MSSPIFRCAKTIANRTITNTNQRRTTTFLKKQSNTTPRARLRTARKISRRKHDFIPSGTQHSRGSWKLSTRATGSPKWAGNDVTFRGRAARSLNGPAASIDPWRFPDERCTRRRGRAQTQTGFRLSPSQPRENRREHQLPRLDAVYRSARLFLLDDEQLGLRAQ